MVGGVLKIGDTNILSLVHASSWLLTNLESFDTVFGAKYNKLSIYYYVYQNSIYYFIFHVKGFFFHDIPPGKSTCIEISLSK